MRHEFNNDRHKFINRHFKHIAKYINLWEVSPIALEI